MTTLNQIVKRLKDLALSHKQIRHFYEGDPVEWLAQGEVKYVACFVYVTGATLDRTEKQTRYSVEIWFADLENVSADAQGNYLEVQSDLTSIAEDYLAMMKSSVYDEDWAIGDSAPIQYYREKFVDWTGAVMMRIDIGLDYLTNRCQVPTELTFENDKDMKNVDLFEYPTMGGTALDSSSISVPGLNNKKILWAGKGTARLSQIGDDDSFTENDQFRYTTNGSAGEFAFPTDLQDQEKIYILYRPL
jgi:hypothetical protein